MSHGIHVEHFVLVAFFKKCYSYCSVQHDINYQNYKEKKLM